MGGHRVASPEFVGRGGELGSLAAALDSALDNGAATVLVGGEAGMGKTRLVTEFCRRAATQHPHLLAATGVCVPADGGALPYGPVAGLLRDIVRQLGDDAAGAILGPLALGLGWAADLDVDGGAFSGGRHTEDLAKTRLFESILAAFTALAQRAPTILVFDDLQWADSASAQLLSFLTRNPADAPLLLIGTYRSEEVGAGHELRPWLAELVRHPRVTHLHLEGLARDDLTAMIAAILGHQPDWTLADAVWARSHGNPFFAEELTAAGPSPSLPPELARVIMARVGALSNKTQQLLRVLAVAVAGSAAEHRLLAELADGFDADALDAALAEAVDNQVVVVDDSRTGYRFRHALLQEAVSASLLPGERARLHRRVAEAMSADASLVPAGADWAATLAGHWWEAGDWANAYAASMDAAGAASALWAFPEAFVHLERALAAVDRMPAGAAARPTASEYLELLDRAAEGAYFVGSERAAELARAAVDATDASDIEARARRFAILGRNTWSVGDSDGAFEAYRTAVEFLPADRPSPELARVMAEEARAIMLMSRARESEGRCHDALLVARAAGAGARAEEAHILYTLGCCRGMLGHEDEAVGLIRESLAIAEELASPDDLNRAYMGLSHFLVASGRLEEGVALVFDSAAIGEALWGVRLNGAAGNSADGLIRLGRYDEAADLLALTGDRGVGTCMTQPQLLRMIVGIRRGDFEAAARWQRMADGTSARLGDLQQRGAYHVASAELALEEGRPEDAFEEVERALDLAVGTDDLDYKPEMCALGTRALADRLEVAQAHGRPVDVDKLRLLARSLVEQVDGMIADAVAGGARCNPRTLAFASTGAAEASRLHTSDPDAWARAAAEWETAGEPYPVAYSRWREAEALLAGRAGRARAEECVQSAWAVASQLGASPLSERIVGLARRARIALADVDAAGTESAADTLASDLGLTPREVEVLAQLAAGRTDKEIADALYISKKTASVHVSNLLRKLDVANRVEAGRVGQAHGLN